MTYRDAAADSGRLGSSNSPVRGRDLCVEQDFRVITIAEQNMRGGYDATNNTAGGTPPMQKRTVAMRGAADMHEMMEPPGE